MTDLKTTIMRMYEITSAEADILIMEANNRVFEGDNPLTVLEEEFGLEPDYIFDLLF